MIRLRSKPRLQHPPAGGAALLGVELHARHPAGGHRAGHRAAVDVGLGRDDGGVAGGNGVGVREVADRRQRGTERARRLRRRRRSSPCAAAARPSRSARPCRAAGRGRRRRPRRFARTAAACPGRRRAARARSRSASAMPVRASVCIAGAAAPTPGSTTRSAPATRSASAVTSTSAPSRSNAARSERRLPAPWSISVTRGVKPRPSCWAAPRPRRVSVAHASRSARASALNAASTTWWSSSPEPSRWIAIRPLRDRESAKWGIRVAGSSPSDGPRSAEVDAREPAAAQIDRGVHEGLVQRRAGVAVAGDALAIAERGVQRPAEHDGDVLDGVVCVHPQVAGAGQVDVDHRVQRQRRHHVVEEADARRHTARPGAVEIDRAGDLCLACPPLDGRRAPAATGRRPRRRRAERLQHAVVVGRRAQRQPDVVGQCVEGADDDRRTQQPLDGGGVRLAQVAEQEVRAGVGDLPAQAAQAPRSSACARRPSRRRCAASRPGRRAPAGRAPPSARRCFPAAGSPPAWPPAPAARGCSRPARLRRRTPCSASARPQCSRAPGPGARGRCRRTRRTPDRSPPARRGAPAASSGVSAPVGLCGVQIQVSRAPAGSSERTPPASRVAFSNIA